MVEEITGLKREYEAIATTAAQFAYEVGVLNDIHVCDAIMANESLTIVWDTTSTPSAEHINEVHLMFHGDQPWGLELQVNSLAGGKTEDYVSHVAEAVYDVSDPCALFSGKNSVEVRDTVVSKLKKTISGRVALSHCWQQHIHLLEMNCNVHPLDGIASAVRSTLRKTDDARELKGVFWQNLFYDNLVYAVSKRRFKQGCGIPKDSRCSSKRRRYVPICSFVMLRIDCVSPSTCQACCLHCNPFLRNMFRVCATTSPPCGQP